MLFLVLALVVVAFGLLVTALATSAMLWAWLSVGASVVAAVLLVVDWRRRRRRSAHLPTAPPVVPATVERADSVELDTDAEPAEEDTDAADLLAVTELDTEIRVVDERPRYHLIGCRWLADRPTLTLPVREARELGFTPCAVCSPDRALAAAHRAG
ncbi:MAG TPA: hypothetical protein VEO01_25305 [Pseudonocardiaceae bacterium]|nr:hypothetical protein [Pseudonocardiaceae bacterium]